MREGSLPRESQIIFLLERMISDSFPWGFISEFYAGITDQICVLEISGGSVQGQIEGDDETGVRESR